MEMLTVLRGRTPYSATNS